jgi:hypothetical protein
VLEEAVRFSTLLFSGAVLLWISNTLGSVLRGTGNMRVPSQTIIATLVLQIIVGGVLALGAGPVPSLGLMGIAIGNLVGMATGALFMVWYPERPAGARLTLRLHGIALRREMFIDILKVGAVACLFSIQSVVSVQVFTGMMGGLGVVPLAGYGIGQRLEFLLVPLSFGMGSAAVPMVGMAIGAGHVARARRVAWTAASVSAFFMAIIGAAVAIWPDRWPACSRRTRRCWIMLASTCGSPAGPSRSSGSASPCTSRPRARARCSVRCWPPRCACSWWRWSGPGSFPSPRRVTAYYWLAPGAMVAYGLSCALAVWLTRWGPAQPR